MSRQPSIIKIIKIDYIAGLGLLFPIVQWGMYAILIFTGKAKTSDYTLSLTFLAITVAAISILIWRIQVFLTVFNEGIESSGIINQIFFFRGRGRVEYVYTYQGQKYIGSNAVLKVKETLALKAGEQVVLLVDRNKPKRAFIRDLYL